jgi:hypothetical protein
MKGARPYPFAKSKHNEIRTYGLRFHFGGWCLCEYSRHRMRRIWRKRARREAKRWIEEQRDAR